MNNLPFRVLAEDWAEATTPEGTLIRFRSTVSGVIDQGPGKYGLRFSPQMEVFAREGQLGKPAPKTKRLGPVHGVVGGQAVSYYRFDGGYITFFTDIKQVFRTDGYFPSGDPVFEVQFNQSFQITAVPLPATTQAR